MLSPQYIALEIVKKYRKLGIKTRVLGILAAKPEAFPNTKSSFIEKPIKLSKDLYSWMFNTHQRSEKKPSKPSGNRSSHEDSDQKPEESLIAKSNVKGRYLKPVFAFIGSKVRAHKKENKALPLLRIIWEDIAKRPKKEIDTILRGFPVPLKQERSTSERVVQAIQLQELINEHLSKLEVKARKINVHFDSITQVTDSLSAKMDHARQLNGLISKYIVNLQTASQEIIKQGNALVVDKGDQALDLQKHISQHILNMYQEKHNIYKQSSTKKDPAIELQMLISKNITEMRETSMSWVATTLKEAITLKVSYPSRVAFIAAKNGNTNFLVELMRLYPDLIWKVNDEGLSIFHVAVKYRQEGIYNLLYDIGAMKDLITPIKDEHGNTMLHLAASRAKEKQFRDVSGVALQMQRELLWFEEVKKMTHPTYREVKNKDGLTPLDLFMLDHKELITQSEKWMKGTASHCMVVAALIATIVFAAAFMVPGGYDENNGIPIFHSKATFMVFVVTDAISLFVSSASILIFLSILTSRYAQNDFLESLPMKLISGLLTLFLSIITMTVVFGVSFFVLYHQGFLWVPILICVLGVLPIMLYLFLQYPLFIDIFHSTWRSRHLFKPKKHVLSYENPKV